MTGHCFSNTDFSEKEIEQLKALSTPVRLDIYNLLGEPMTVTEIATALGADRKALYHHVELLKSAALIEEVDINLLKT